MKALKSCLRQEPVLCASALCALLSFVAGVILDVVVKKHRQLFELMLTLMEEGNCRAGQADQKADR